jgi:hypothetical protein
MSKATVYTVSFEIECIKLRAELSRNHRSECCGIIIAGSYVHIDENGQARSYTILHNHSQYHVLDRRASPGASTI